MGMAIMMPTPTTIMEIQAFRSAHGGGKGVRTLFVRTTLRMPFAENGL